MNLNMISKSLLVALPMLALSACSSTSDMDSESTESAAAQAVEQTMDATAAADNMVQTDTMEAVETLTEEELMVQQYSDAILATMIQFDFDKSMIKPEFTRILDAHAAYLVEHPAKSITVEGHADEKGTPEYNIALGERRAVAVATYLESMGVESTQLTIVSYGEEKPFNLGHSEAALAENRRAQLVY